MSWKAYTKPFKLTFKQVGLYELAMVSLGIIIGIYWGDTLNKIEILFWIIFLGAGGYILKVWLNQIK